VPAGRCQRHHGAPGQMHATSGPATWSNCAAAAGVARPRVQRRRQSAAQPDGRSWPTCARASLPVHQVTFVPDAARPVHQRPWLEFPGRCRAAAPADCTGPRALGARVSLFHGRRRLGHGCRPAPLAPTASSSTPSPIAAAWGTPGPGRAAEALRRCRPRRTAPPAWASTPATT